MVVTTFLGFTQDLPPTSHPQSQLNTENPTAYLVQVDIPPRVDSTEVDCTFVPYKFHSNKSVSEVFPVIWSLLWPWSDMNTPTGYPPPLPPHMAYGPYGFHPGMMAAYYGYPPYPPYAVSLYLSAFQQCSAILCTAWTPIASALNSYIKPLTTQDVGRFSACDVISTMSLGDRRFCVSWKSGREGERGGGRA